MPTYAIVILIIVLCVLIIDPYIALWEAMHSISDKIDTLAFSVSDLSTKLEAIKPALTNTHSAELNQAQTELNMAQVDLKLARTDLAQKNRHAAQVAVEDGLNRAHVVRLIVEKLTTK